jgi:thioredoxin 2
MEDQMLLTCHECKTINKLPAEKLNLGPKCGSCSTPLLSYPIDLTIENFKEALENCPIPLLIDFWAAWCGPCKSFAPIFGNAAKKYYKKMVFCKVDTDAESLLASQYQIRSIPTLIAFKNGVEINRVSGALPPLQLEELINKLPS